MCLRLVTLDLQDHMEVQPKCTLTKWWQGGRETMHLIHNLHLFCTISMKVFIRTVCDLWMVKWQATVSLQLLPIDTFYLYTIHSAYKFIHFVVLAQWNCTRIIYYYLLLLFEYSCIVRTFFELYSV